MRSPRQFSRTWGPRTRTCKLVLGDPQGQGLSSRTTTLVNFSPRSAKRRLTKTAISQKRLDIFLHIIFRKKRHVLSRYLLSGTCTIFILWMWLCLLQRATCAVTAVGLQRPKNKMFSDNPYVENTPSPSVDIRGITVPIWDSGVCANVVAVDISVISAS